MEDVIKCLVPIGERIKKEFFLRAKSEGDLGVIRQVFTNDEYGLADLKRTVYLHAYANEQRYCGKKLLIIDAGANIGASSVYFHHRHPGSKVIAIEPEKNNAALLEQNCTEEDIVVLKAALASQLGALYVSDPGMGDWGFRVGKQGTEEVQTVTINDILKQFPGNCFAPYICKLDIEGSEAEVFSQNFEWLDQFPLIIIELHDWLFPGEANSRNFRKALVEYDFDFIYRGENAFCFNNRILRQCKP